MKSAVLLFLVIVRPACAQSLVWMDISGEWRTGNEDRPQYASPAFNDSAWRVVRLPGLLPRARNGGITWIRRAVHLPDGAGREPLVLTLGVISERTYELYINGRKVPAPANVDNLETAEIPQPHSYDVPAESIGETGSLTIALRTRPVTTTPVWRLPDHGPYLITTKFAAPARAWGQTDDITVVTVRRALT